MQEKRYYIKLDPRDGKRDVDDQDTRDNVFQYRQARENKETYIRKCNTESRSMMRMILDPVKP